MEQCRSFQQIVSAASHEEMRGFISNFGPKDFIVCPRPRRIGLSTLSSLQPGRCHLSHATDQCNSKAGWELLDLILTKEESVMEPHHASEEIDSSPPFFSGSPPSRAGNPLIQDAKFRHEETNPIREYLGASQICLPSPLLFGHEGFVEGPSAAKRKPAAPVRVEGCNILGRESKRSDNPAATRVEGFDILSRDRGNSSVSAAIRVEGFDILTRDRRNSGVSAAA